MSKNLTLFLVIILILGGGSFFAIRTSESQKELGVKLKKEAAEKEQIQQKIAELETAIRELKTSLEEKKEQLKGAEEFKLTRQALEQLSAEVRRLESKKEGLIPPQEEPYLKEQAGEKKEREGARGTEYTIGVDDVLFISIWQSPEFDREVVVRPDGKISFPLIGEIRSMGLSITQFNQEITERIREYIKHPEVSVSIRKLGGKKVFVLGEVRHPGVYAVGGEKTLIEAISSAGGFTKDAVPSSTIIIRGGFQKPEAKRINLSKVFNGRPTQDIAIEPEDIVFIPKKFIADLNYFLTQMLGPFSSGTSGASTVDYWKGR